MPDLNALTSLNIRRENRAYLIFHFVNSALLNIVWNGDLNTIVDLLESIVAKSDKLDFVLTLFHLLNQLLHLAFTICCVWLRIALLSSCALETSFGEEFRVEESHVSFSEAQSFTFGSIRTGLDDCHPPPRTKVPQRFSLAEQYHETHR